MLALGVVIVSRSTSFTGDLVRVLFGEMLGISASALIDPGRRHRGRQRRSLDLRRPFLLLCFNPEQAQVPVSRCASTTTSCLALIAITVIVSFQTVGTLLVFGMLLAPAGAGALLARRIGR